ncbi:MAG TPA: ABC transporter permease [Solirubrobacteraceae bacterium]|nr:ABC transporter permease [Solirubrobacteraceae bacterium]
MSDTLIMAGRCLRLTRRNLDTLIVALVLPALLMVLFVVLFGGAIHTGTRYVTYVAPGVLLLCAGYGASLTAVGVCQDMTGGFIDRLRAMDVAGACVLAGHVAASVVRNVASAALALGVAIALGFRPHAGPLEWLAAIGVLVAFITAMSAVATALGLMARTPEAASGYTFVIMFLPYASSAFVPVRTMPGWLRGFAGHQPITPINRTLHALLLGGHADALVALAWCAGLVAVSLAAAGVLFSRRTAH